jgi:hypothetical protein
VTVPDKHDPREFKHYAKIALDGTVVSTFEVAADREPPSSGDAIHVEITDQFPYDLGGKSIAASVNAATSAKAGKNVPLNLATTDPDIIKAALVSADAIKVKHG